MSEISVVMPTMNEEKSIAKVIGDIKKYAPKGTEILIVDSGQDQTAEIALSLGAKVIKQPPQGAGKALITALTSASGEIIITTDCDDTYPIEMLPDFISLINQGFDIVSGNRLHQGIKAMPLINKFGNWLFAALIRIIYGIKTCDVTTGMRAYRKSVVHSHTWETNYAFPLEIIIKSVKNGFRYTEINIPYRERIGIPTLNKWRSGKAYIYTILKYKFNLKLKNKVL